MEEDRQSLLSSSFTPVYTDIGFKYRFLKTLDNSRYGILRLASLKTLDSAQVAVKTISKARVKVSPDSLNQEIQTLFLPDHPNIVRLYEVFEDDRNIHLVTEYCSGPSLFDCIVQRERYSEAEATSLLRKILLAVSSLHHCNICHRDLKLENFMFEDSSPGAELKLIDFGISNKVFGRGDQSEQKTVVGTPDYIAPEAMYGAHGLACDMWSVGVIMYAMLSGELPFTGDTASETVGRAMSGSFSVTSKAWERVSPAAIDLLRKLLVVDPKGRMSAGAALRHHWFSQTPIRQPISLSLIDALKNYSVRSQLQAEAHIIIAKLLNVSHHRDIKDTFLALDKDQNGYLNAEELTKGLEEVSYNLTSAEMAEILRNVNYSKDGRIKYSEFLAAIMMSRTLLDDDVIWCAFSLFDVDRTGQVSEGNMKEGLRRVGRYVTDGDVHAIMREVGADEDVFSYMQFKKVVMRGRIEN
jgi:calcium-dependent protein kinase